MLSSIAVKVLSTVNAPYGTNLAPEELAALISDPDSAATSNASAFAFFSEVSEDLQIAFLEEMELDCHAVGRVAASFSDLSGYPLPLASRVRGAELKR